MSVRNSKSDSVLEYLHLPKSRDNKRVNVLEETYETYYITLHRYCDPSIM